MSRTPVMAMPFLCFALSLPLVAAVAIDGASHQPAKPVARTPLAAAVAEVLSPPAIRAGGTTPRAAVLTDDNEVGAFAVGTPAIVASYVRAIETAQDEILLQVYQWADEDEASSEVRQAFDRRLTRAQWEQQPFRVGLLVGNAMQAEFPLHIARTVAMLAEHAERHHLLRVEVLTYDGTLFDILHSKTLIQDGRVGIVSTANLYTHGGMQRDSFNMAAHVRGPVVAALMQDWHHARHHAHGLYQRHLGTVSFLPSEDVPWGERAQTRAHQRFDDQDTPFSQPTSLSQASVLSRPARNIYWSGGDTNPQAQGLLALFRSAQHRIVAINPALNVASFKDALVEAMASRGVEVDLLLSFHMNRRRQHMMMGGDNSDTALDLYTRLLSQGGEEAANRLRIYFGTNEQGELAAPSHPGNIHAKVASFDGDALLIGSTNWDWPSYNSARELSVVFFGSGVGRVFEDDVFAPRLQFARPIRAGDLPAFAQKSHMPAYLYLLRRAQTP